MDRHLSTHTLDTSSGAPASGVKIELWRLDPEPKCLNAVVTNHDGRTDSPLLAGEQFQPGAYELRFFVGAYFGANHIGQSTFYDQIPVRFIVSDSSRPYHVPLLISPFGYSTYRGS